jgi:hypothetical protein
MQWENSVYKNPVYYNEFKVNVAILNLYKT